MLATVSKVLEFWGVLEPCLHCICKPSLQGIWVSDRDNAETGVEPCVQVLAQVGQSFADNVAWRELARMYPGVKL